MVNRINLNIEDRVISSSMLHQRTLLRWATSVDSTALKLAIRESIIGDTSAGHTYQFAGNHEFIVWAAAALLEAGNTRIRVTLHPITEWPVIGERSLARLQEMSVVELPWDDRDTMAFMCLGTYRALIKKQQGFIPGINGNITIAGAMATVLKLGLGITPSE